MDLITSALTSGAIAQAVTIAIEVIAFIEAIKNFYKDKEKRAPAWAYTLTSFIFCIGLAFFRIEAWTRPAIMAQIEVGLLAAAIAQLGYDSIYKALQGAIKKINGGLNE